MGLFRRKACVSAAPVRSSNVEAWISSSKQQVQQRGGFACSGASLTLVNSAHFSSLVANKPGDLEQLTFSSRSSVQLRNLDSNESSRNVRNAQRYVGVLCVKNWSIGILSKQQSNCLQKLNSVIRRHCDRLPLSWACITQPSYGECGFDELANTSEGSSGSALASERQKRVLILMSDTGGGHRASAEAIKATFELEYGNEYVVNIIDLWKDHTPWPFNQVPRTYNFLVKHETLWKFTFHGTRPRLVHQTNFAATGLFIAREIAKGILKYKPDVIVSVHPLMQHIPLRILKTRGLLRKIPFTTVITDLNTCHPTWFHKLATVCFCPSNEVAQRALKAGLKPSQLRIHGLPVRPTFCQATRPKEELRRDLGMDEELPAVLLMGGGEGMGPVEETALALGEVLRGSPSGRPLGQVVIICGRNKRLARRLSGISWSIPVQVRGFEANMQEWMGACDCIITKAGPGTIAEAMIKGLPMILNDFIAGQEVGNVPYVVDNGAGKFSENPKEIATIVAQWFSTKCQEFTEMAENALKLARPDAVFRIVHDLADLAQNKSILAEPAGVLAA